MVLMAGVEIWSLMVGDWRGVEVGRWAVVWTMMKDVWKGLTAMEIRHQPDSLRLRAGHQSASAGIFRKKKDKLRITNEEAVSSIIIIEKYHTRPQIEDHPENHPTVPRTERTLCVMF